MWPRFCHSRAVFKATFARAARELGNRIDNIKVEQHGDKYSVDFSRYGCYTLEPLEGAKSHIKFISGGLRVALTDFAVPGDEFQILDNTNPLKACITLKRASCRCIELFGEEEQNIIKQECSSRGDLLPKFTATSVGGGFSKHQGLETNSRGHGVLDRGCKSPAKPPCHSRIYLGPPQDFPRKSVLLGYKSVGVHDSLHSGVWLQRIANEEQQALDWPEQHHSQARHDDWHQQWASAPSQAGSHTGSSWSGSSYGRVQQDQAPASAEQAAADQSAAEAQQQQDQQQQAGVEAAPPAPGEPSGLAVEVENS